MLVKKIKTVMTVSLVLIVAVVIGQTAVAAEQYLMKPTGKYAVGFKDIRLVNGTLKNGSYTCPGKPDLFYIKGKNELDFGKDNRKDFCREIMLRVYYPIEKTSSLSYAPYYSPAMKDMQSMIRKAKVPGIKEKDISALGTIKTFSVENKSIANKHFPAIIFDPGSATEVQQYENIIANLVSHGYILFAINNTFVGSSIAFPDGRIVQFNPSFGTQKTGELSAYSDILYVRDLINNPSKPVLPFIANVDFGHIGLMGHSLGGMTVVQVVRQSRQALFQAAVSLDGLPAKFGTINYSPSEMKGFQIPFLRLFSSGWKCFFSSTPINQRFILSNNNYYVLLSQTKASQKKCDASPPRFYTGHLNFTDWSTLQDQKAFSAYLKYKKQRGDWGSVGTANGEYIAKTINDYVLQFFNMYLKAPPVPAKTYETCKAISSDSMIKCGPRKY